MKAFVVIAYGIDKPPKEWENRFLGIYNQKHSLIKCSHDFAERNIQKYDLICDYESDRSPQENFKYGCKVLRFGKG